MFGLITGKLRSVQNEISEGFRQLKQKRPLSQRGLPSNVSFHLEFIDSNAGAEILHSFTESWRRIHSATSESAEKARQIDADLQSLQNVVERKSTELIQLQMELGRLNLVSDELSNLITETAKLEGLCEEIESALAYLDVLSHTEDMQNTKLEQRFQLALYRECKMGDLNETKTQMALDYMQETERLDKRRQLQHLDKLKVLQDAAEKDINTFRTSGVITNSLFFNGEKSTKSGRGSQIGGEGDSVALASYSPQFGSDEQRALEDFLADAKLEDSEAGQVIQDANGNGKRSCP